MVPMVDASGMDKGKAIDRFLSRADQLGQLLLVSNDEVEKLLGEEVAAALAEMESFSHEQQLCSQCGGDCCRDIGCELYAPQFSQCPIQDLRPLVCRLHFCHRFDAAYKSLVMELRDVFLGCFQAVDLWDGSYLKWLDVPPLAGASPELISTLSHWVEKVRDGTLDPGQAVELIRREAEEYRSRYSDGTNRTGGTATS
jgi:hypothetical protein